jgi:ribosomal protein S21
MENPEIKIENKPIDPIKFTGIRVEVRQVEGKEAQLFQLDKALKIFKKKLEKDNVLRIIKERRYYTKPSALKRTEAKKAKNRKK